jgi:putative restriction endonuclease
MNRSEDILNNLRNMSYDKNKNRYTTGKSPHKPLLILTLIILHDNGKIDLTDIKPDLDLMDTWSELWKCLKWYDKPGSLQQPLYYMKKEEFWNIDFKEGKDNKVPRSISAFEKSINRISMTTDMVDLIEDEESRKMIINTLLNAGYFTRSQIGSLEKKMKTIDASFKYEEIIKDKIVTNGR